MIRNGALPRTPPRTFWKRFLELENFIKMALPWESCHPKVTERVATVSALSRLSIKITP